MRKDLVRQSIQWIILRYQNGNDYDQNQDGKLVKMPELDGKIWDEIPENRS